MFANDELGLQQRYLNMQYRKNSKQIFILSQFGSPRSSVLDEIIGAGCHVRTVARLRLGPQWAAGADPWRVGRRVAVWCRRLRCVNDVRI